MVQVVLKEYLMRLKVAQYDRPKKIRREVPTLIELAKAAGVTRQTMSRFVNNETLSINREIFTNIILELRRYGFDPKVGHLLVIEEQ